MLSSESLFARSQESLTDIEADEFIDFIEPKIEYAQSLDSLRSRLLSEEKLKVKLGIDPTGPEIHIGHIVPIRLLDFFARAGHDIDLIFGDFTAKIGDPSGRSSGRSAITDDEITSNVATYREQVDGYFNTERENVTIHRNNTWLGRMVLSEVFEYLQMVNLSEATQRKDFRERIERGFGVSLAEAMYGTLQGIDSVILETDVEIGGIDQLLNVQQARNVQRQRGQVAEEILLTPIIEGTSGDGRKMSKSYGNYIASKATSNDIFGKIMSIPDNLIEMYYLAFAPIRENERKKLSGLINQDPMEAKKQLGSFMVSLARGKVEAGPEAREEFERKFSRKEINEQDITPIISPSDAILLETLFSTGQFSSKSELRRLAKEGGIKLNDVRIGVKDLLSPISQDRAEISVGKHKHYRVEFSAEDNST